MAESLGLLTIKNNADLSREEEDRARQELEAQQNSEPMLSLAAYVHQCWEAAAQAKDPHKEAMLKSLRQRNGIYEPDKLQQIEQSGVGSTIYMMLTDEKCTACESWMEDIMLPPDDKPWGVKPTPEPEISPEMLQALQKKAEQVALNQVQEQAAQANMQGQAISQEDLERAYRQQLQEVLMEMQNWVSEQAQKANDELETDLDDELTEAKWIDALREAIPDIVTYKAGFLKGPFTRYKETIVWGEDGQPTVDRVPRVEFENVSPFDIYPAPSARKIDDGYLIERHDLTRSSLIQMKGPDSAFDDNAIDAVLDEYGQGGLRSWLWRSSDTTLNQIQGHGHEAYDPEARIEALQFWGAVQGLKLLEWGMSAEEIEPFEDYYVEAWLIGRYIIKAELNSELLGRKPYYKASFRERNGQFWGFGLPELIQDCQDGCNAAARNLFNNMGISSGPQVGVDISSLAPGEDITQVYPWKIWQFDGNRLGQSSQPPLWFFQPQPNIEALMGVYDRFSMEADNKSGIPKYSYGGNSQGDSGAASTASGFSMMMNNATKGIRKIIANVDRGIIRPSVRRLFEHLLLNDEEFSRKYKGDIDIVARGSSELAAKEQQQVRRNEFLQLVLQSQVAQQIIELPGIAEILKEVAEGMDIGLGSVVPTKEQVRRKQIRAAAQEAMMMQQQAAQGQGGPEMGRQVHPGGAVQGGADARTV